MKRRFQSRITTGRFTLPVAALLSVACWLLIHLVFPGAAEVEQGRYSLTVLGFLLYSLIGYLLIWFNNLFAIIRVRASVQTSIFALLIAVCPELHTLTAGDLGTICFLASLFLLFRSFRKECSEGTLFYAFVCIGLGSLFFPKLIFFIPLLWAGALGFQSLTLRSFFASVVGWGLPYWFLWGYGFYFDRMELFYRPFRELAAFSPVDFSFQPWTLATLAYSLALYLTSTAHCLAVSYEDKIQTRSYLQFLMLLTLYTFTYMALQPSLAVHLLPILFIGISILSGHLFTLTHSRASNIFFICALIGLLALFVFNLTH